MTMPTFGHLLGRYLPAMALALALALIVALIPSKPPVASDASSAAAIESLLAGAPSGTREAEGAATTIDPGAPAGSSTGGSATTAKPRSPGSPGSPGASRAGGTDDGSAGGVSGSTPASPGAPTAAGADCSRNLVLRGVTCRPPAFAGSNGGATGRGVTGDAINVVFYQPQQNQQVEAALGAAGIPTKEERLEVLRAWEAYLNSAYETYGRKVKLILYYGAAAPTDAAGQQADAIKVADELKAFAVMSPTAGPAFWTELHRKGIPGFSNTQYERELYDELAPHLLGLLPDIDTINQHLAEYYCKRLVGRKAVYAGDPVYQTQQRKLGIIYLDNGRNQMGARLAKELESTCGAKAELIQGYSGDVSTASQQSTTIVAAMRDKGVTTVTCLCDPIFPAYFTKQATTQGWFPEWIQNGLFGTDLILFGRVYDQQQWSRSFGMSAFEYPIPSAEDPSWRAYKAGNRTGTNKNAKAVGTFYFWAARAIIDSIEAAGPNLNDQTFLKALFALAPVQYGNSPRYSFGRNGPGTYTATDDLTEVWWSSTREGTDGKPGTFFNVAAGKRYVLGQWPGTEPVVFADDGTAQPKRDPDA